MEKAQYTYRTLVYSLFLFAVSGIIGIVPLSLSVIAWHLAVSGKKERIVRMRPWVIGAVIIGYVALVVAAIVLIINRQLFLGPDSH